MLIFVGVESCLICYFQINNTEKVNVRCRIHHWSKNVVDRVPHYREFWRKPTECIDPDFAPILAQLPTLVVKEVAKEEDMV